MNDEPSTLDPAVYRAPRASRLWIGPAWIARRVTSRTGSTQRHGPDRILLLDIACCLARHL